VNVIINETIASSVEKVKKIYKKHESLSDEKRQHLIEETEQTFDMAAKVLVVYDVGRSQLHERSYQLPQWIKCFKEFIHYRSLGQYDSHSYHTHHLCILFQEFLKATRQPLPFDHCPSTAFLPVRPHYTNARRNRCQDLNSCPFGELEDALILCG